MRVANDVMIRGVSISEKASSKFVEIISHDILCEENTRKNEDSFSPIFCISQYIMETRIIFNTFME